MRAILIVAAGPEALAAALASGAGALIVDLEDGAPLACPAMGGGDAPRLYLRSANPDRDLPVMMAAAPHGIVLPRCAGARDVARLGARLAVEEAIRGLADGGTRILAEIATARGIFALHGLAGASSRLSGITLDAEALQSEIGAPENRDAAGSPIPPLAQARSLVRLAAAAAGVEAIDAACLPGGDLAAEVAAARRDGFGSKIATCPAQVRVIEG